MILVDLNQTMISNLMVSLGPHKNVPLDESMLRHMVLNSLRSYNQKFKSEYGEMVICVDASNYWRKKVFPYYKASRRRKMDKSELDWKTIFDSLRTIREEIKEFLPYRVVEVDTAEADDCIAVLSRRHSLNERVLIISGDHDFIQLHGHNIEQYDPIRKRGITHPDPAQYLLEHIIRGDSGDGVPNILSGDDVFVSDGRQKPITQKRMEWWTAGMRGLISAELEELLEEDKTLKRNFDRNTLLVDLRYIPDDLVKKINESYDSQPTKNRSKMMSYFIEKRLRHLMESIPDF